jgi:sec-independent protein translocase protein TatA
MGAFSIWHWVIVLVVVLILFGGKGKLSGIMGDFGKGLKNFKDQVKSNKETEETELINEVLEKKVKPNKRKTSAKSSPKKKATKNKS